MAEPKSVIQPVDAIRGVAETARKAAKAGRIKSIKLKIKFDGKKKSPRFDANRFG